MSTFSEFDIDAAKKRIAKTVHHTPVIENRTLNGRSGARVFLKCENFQKAGSFKIRGAANAVLKLSSEEKRRGVVTHSSGNHGGALAYAAAKVGIRAYVVMPENAPGIKKKAVKEYGGEITFCSNSLQSREEECRRIAEETGAMLIPPYDHRDIIEGQASCSIEIFEELENIDYLIAPVGGGGLLSGCCVAGERYSPETKIVGCEPSGADGAARSIKRGELVLPTTPNTIADGLRASLGVLNFKILKEGANNILTVNDDEIIAAMRFVYERVKLVIEPSSAVPVAVLLKYPEMFKDKRIAVILSGGNVDLNRVFGS